MRELLLTGIGAAILLVTVTIWWVVRRRRTRIEVRKAANTLDVIPLPAPRPPVLPPQVAAPPSPQPSPRVIVDDDIEGRTVPAPMTSEEAYEMHARYAPAFDQQLAVARYVERHGDVDVGDESNPAEFDQQRYANALHYADAFEQQLAKQRRTQVYAAIVGPRRVARGSYTPQQFTQRSDQSNLQQWDNKTVVGVKPAKPAK